VRELEGGEARAIAAAFLPRVRRMLGDRAAAAPLFWKEVLESRVLDAAAFADALEPERIELLIGSRGERLFEVDAGEIEAFAGADPAARAALFTRDFKILAVFEPGGAAVVGAPERVLKRLEAALADATRRAV
jgi:hypothetical protein